MKIVGVYWKMDTVNNAISPICFRVNHAWYENKRLTSIAVLYRLRGVAPFSFYLHRARGDLCVLLLFHLKQVNHLRCKNGISFFIMLEANIIHHFFSTRFSSQLFIYKNYINPIHNTKFTSVGILFPFAKLSKVLKKKKIKFSSKKETD